MYPIQAMDKQRVRKDKAKRAIALAMQNRWSEAVSANQSIIREFPEDLEAHNRLGKALAELGRNREAIEAFRRALKISSNNTIATKNLTRLMQLDDEAPKPCPTGGAAPKVFIEESGKAGVTTLLNLASSKMLLKLAPGHLVQLSLEGGTLKINGPSDEYVGQVEPRLASRLVRLIKGGNRYEATVTSAGERELSVIIREVYQHPSQAGTVSFPSRGGTDYRIYLPSTLVGLESGEEEAQEKEPVAVKDWSDDDTEPGDDEAFSPVLHRIIQADDESATEDDF